MFFSSLFLHSQNSLFIRLEPPLYSILMWHAVLHTSVPRRCAGELCDSPKLKSLGSEDMLWLPQFSVEQHSHYPLSIWLFMLNGSPTVFGSPPQLRENEHKPRKQRWFFTSSRKQQCWEELPDDSYNIIAGERDKMIKKKKGEDKKTSTSC